MVVDERSRHALFQRLEATLGEETAAMLMEYLPPAGWGDVATRRDVDGLRVEMHGEFRVVRSELHAEVAGLHTEIATVRTEVAELRADLRGEIATLATSLRGEIATQGTDLRGEIAAAFTTQTRIMLFSMFAAVVALGGFVLGVARLGS